MKFTDLIIESKVTVYHGTTKPIDNIQQKNRRWKGISFATNIPTAKKFGKNIYKTSINIKKLLDLTNNANDSKIASELGIDIKKYKDIKKQGEYGIMTTDNAGFNITPINDIVDYAKKNKFDTIKYKDVYDVVYTITDFDNIVEPLTNISR